MTKQNQKQLGRTLWNIADQLRGAMSADDFRDYMLSFLFLRYLSDNYVEAAKKELGRDYPELEDGDKRTPLQVWYEANERDVADFEEQMRLKVHYVIEPPFLWSHIAELARTQRGELLGTLQKGFSYIENKSFESTFGGLFSEINLGSEKLGKNYEARYKKLTKIIAEIAKGLDEFSTDKDTLGDAYEYLIGQFAAGSGKKAGEFYTPQQISDILSAIVTLDSQEPKTGKRKKLDGVMAIILPHGVLFRGGVEARIRKKLLDDGHIDTVIGLPANLFYSTGIPVCILVLKKCKKPDDVLFINASEHYAKDKRQNRLRIGDNGEPNDIDKIISTYINRPPEEERYSRRVGMDEIVENDYNLNITRYVSTAKPEPIIDLGKTHKAIVSADEDIRKMTAKHNEYLEELGLPLLPNGTDKPLP